MIVSPPVTCTSPKAGKVSIKKNKKLAKVLLNKFCMSELSWRHIGFKIIQIFIYIKQLISLKLHFNFNSFINNLREQNKNRRDQCHPIFLFPAIK